MVAEPDTFHSHPAPGQHSVSRWECADVPDVSNEERNDDLSSTVLAKTAWQCKPEFSTDKMVGDNKNLTAKRRWSRTVSVPAECQISDGCVGSLCGSHAVLSEQSDINGRCLEGYTCECDSGFELKSTARDSEVCHACEKRAGLSWWKACVPVSCVDKINGYSCS